jgi:hypothetical protein
MKEAQMLAPQSPTRGTNDMRRRGPAVLLVILVITAVLVVLISRDGAVVGPDAHYTNASPTAQVVWDG